MVLSDNIISDQRYPGSLIWEHDELRKYHRYQGILLCLFVTTKRRHKKVAKIPIIWKVYCVIISYFFLVRMHQQWAVNRASAINYQTRLWRSNFTSSQELWLTCMTGCNHLYQYMRIRRPPTRISKSYGMCIQGGFSWCANKNNTISNNWFLVWPFRLCHPSSCRANIFL